MTFSEALAFALTPFSWGFDVFVRILSRAHALPVYLGLFLVYTVSRLFIRRWVGEGSSESKGRKRNNMTESSED